MLAEHGREFRNNTSPEQPIDPYEKIVLPLAPKEDRLDDWATTQHNFGNAPGLLGQRHRATQLLERAILVIEQENNSVLLQTWLSSPKPFG